MIDALRMRHPLCLLLHHAGLSRAGYYKWKNAQFRNAKNSDVEQHILAIHSIRPYYGYRRMTIALRREGFMANHKRVYRLMKKLGIQSIIRKKRRYCGNLSSIIFPDLLQRKFSSLAPRRKLVTDITYLPTFKGFIYLSVVQDLHNNEIVAHSLSVKNDLELVLASFKQLESMPGAVLHSDQGFQYTHKSYQRELNRLEVIGSHSKRGNCLDNAAMESFFSHLKTEGFAGKELLGREETMTLVEDYIRFYNTERFQKRLGQLSPVEYREKMTA